MSPRITAHGGASHKGDPPVRKPKSFGAMLAAARAGEELSGPAVEAEPAETPGEAALVDSTPYIVADEPEPVEAEPKKRAPRKVQGKGTAVIGGIEATDG